jgi:hypothetical protein
MAEWEIERWCHLKDVRDWHAFMSVTESLVYSDWPIAVCCTQHADAESTRLWREEVEATDGESLAALGWRAGLGLNADWPVADGLTGMSIAEASDILSGSQLRAGAHREAAAAVAGESVRIALTGRYLPQAYDADACAWLLTRFACSQDDMQAVRVRSADCKVTGRSEDARHMSSQQAAYDKAKDRQCMGASPYADRAWQVFETGEMPPPWQDSKGVAHVHDPHASQCRREYEATAVEVRGGRTMTVRGRRTTTVPVLPRKCFTDWIDWPDTCVYGDIKDAIWEWLTDLLGNTSVVEPRAVFVHGLRVRGNGKGEASVEVPRRTWRMIVGAAHPELEALHAKCTALACVSKKPGQAWAKAVGDRLKTLSVRSRVLFSRFIRVYNTAPTVVFTGKPVQDLAVQAQSWRRFYTTLADLGLDPSLQPPEVTNELYADSPARGRVTVQ